jgi:hypothetical protein
MQIMKEVTAILKKTNETNERLIKIIEEQEKRLTESAAREEILTRLAEPHPPALDLENQPTHTPKARTA